MERTAGKLIAFAIIVAEVGSLGIAPAPASAQTATQEQRQIARQQRIILQQQKQIQDNQRQLEAQQQLRQGGPAAAPQNLNRGIFGNIGGCPVGYTYSLFSGCLPTIVVLH